MAHGATGSTARGEAAIRRLATEAVAMPGDDPRRIAASIAMFERLAEHWSLRGSERETLLGGVSKSTWSEWRQRPAAARIKADTRERIADLFTIDLNVHALFGAEFADRWIREPNAALGGESPLATMLRGKVEDVIRVRRYLERVRTSSPLAVTHSQSSGTPADLAVSYLPGELEAAGKDAGLAVLRRGVAIIESLASNEPLKYNGVLTSALITLATWLAEDNQPAEAAAVRRRSAQLQRRGASEPDENA